MSFGKRINEVMIQRGISASTLSRQLNWNSGVISQYVNKPDRDPRLSTAIKIADALGVSLDYLAGRETSHDISFYDAETEHLAENFNQLNRNGRMVVRDTLEFQLTKNTKSSKSGSMQNNKIPGVA